MATPTVGPQDSDAASRPPERSSIDDAPAGDSSAPELRRDAPPPMPRPLIPASRSTATPSAPHESGPRPSAGPAVHTAETTPDEVHVHIGRIEVTAVHEAPKPRKRPPRGQAPMSLDDYLAKRQRGGT